MNLQIPDFIKKTLNNYRNVYKVFMECTDEEMPDDTTLINIALLSDMEYMMKQITLDEKKGESL